MSVTLHTTLGDIKIEVFCESVPRTAENFLALCASGYYDGCTFHRNIPGFLTQAGDPTGTGKGGSSATGLPIPLEIRAALRHHARGVVSMAHRGAKKKAAPGDPAAEAGAHSQFFITYAPQPNLDNNHTVFGKVISGLETLEDLERVPVDEKQRPLSPVTIKNVTIHANPMAH
ncbi:peptidylprolyl isomerase [Fonticula alba]|uniref:Peptidyl-prolyl cis-trans isomerase n=1 Tax=Fonticula alba TaxID=691883 RepID=A0A058ZGA9_FONAL|nr:peptidylprolyl isomerase [Fonticula alba]KCV73435.1 peptidylprolyl isomerase [Fonticula alba]|eukprot:XP_009493136.1 peptidylprolyl isomerase [Fonticula alba]